MCERIFVYIFATNKGKSITECSLQTACRVHSSFKLIFFHDFPSIQSFQFDFQHIFFSQAVSVHGGGGGGKTGICEKNHSQ